MELKHRSSGIQWDNYWLGTKGETNGQSIKGGVGGMEDKMRGTKHGIKTRRLSRRIAGAQDGGSVARACGEVVWRRQVGLWRLGAVGEMVWQGGIYICTVRPLAGGGGSE